MDKLQDIREALAAATPGPWRWSGYTKGKTVDMIALHSGHPTVMAFERWGMGGAAPAFNTDDGMKRIDEPGMVRYRQAHRQNEFVEINHPDAHLIANAPEYLAHLLETVEQLQNESEKLEKRIDDLRRENDQLHTQKGTLRHECGKLELQNTAMKEALEKAERFNSAMMSFYGDGLMVHNWHQNGDGEPWDNFFDENGAHEAFEAVTAALSTIEGGKATLDPRGGDTT